MARVIALGGPPPADDRVPKDFGISRVEAPAEHPGAQPRLIGWVLWEVHGVVVEKKGMVYARTGDQ